jgi:hypothetical protein
MLNTVRPSARAVFLMAAILTGLSLSVSLAGCSSPQPAKQAQGPRRYALQGRVVSVEKAKLQVVVDGENVPGFMMPMTMPYSVKSPHLLDALSPEDQVTADIVVNENDVWLENIVVVKKADETKAPSANESHPSSTTPSKK